MRRSFACLLALLLSACASKQRFDLTDHSTKRVAGFEAENARLDPAKRYVVLVGDSLTEGWAWEDRIARFLPTLKDRTLNRGISGDGVGLGAQNGVKRRLDASIYDCRPGVVFLLIGVNDIGLDGSGVAPAAQEHEALVRQVRARVPDVPLVLVTLAPARGKFAPLNPHVLAFNEHVRRVAGECGCELLDLHALFVDEQGELKAELATKDGLHWTDAAYEVLGREVEVVVAALEAR